MPNRLQHESSPYLLQHASNPVDWYPWGDEAGARAVAEAKPVLVSIGYASCHWCHVMERESFADPKIAALLNKHFISIKVDREERPDLDALYIDALQTLTGAAGWPLTLFLTPERKLFFGGTYFPPTAPDELPSFRAVPESVIDARGGSRRGPRGPAPGSRAPGDPPSGRGSSTTPPSPPASTPTPGRPATIPSSNGSRSRRSSTCWPTSPPPKAASSPGRTRSLAASRVPTTSGATTSSPGWPRTRPPGSG